MSLLLRNLPSLRHIKENMERYAIVDSKGEIIQKFRIKGTARNLLSELQKDHYQKLKIVELE